MVGQVHRLSKIVPRRRKPLTVRWRSPAGARSKGSSSRKRFTSPTLLRLRPPRASAAEVINKLGLVRYRNQLMPAATAEVLKKQAKESEAALAKWKPILSRLRGDLESRDKNRQEAARKQFKDAPDPAMIPALEAVFATAKPEVGQAAVDALIAMPQQAATDSLVRFALLAKHEGMRDTAAAALKGRDPFTFVPFLLSQMQMPIEVSFTGSPFHSRLTLFREGPFFNSSYTSTVDGQPLFAPLPVLGGTVLGPTIRNATLTADSELRDLSARMVHLKKISALLPLTSALHRHSMVQRVTISIPTRRSGGTGGRSLTR